MFVTKELVKINILRNTIEIKMNNYDLLYNTFHTLIIF